MNLPRLVWHLLPMRLPAAGTPDFSYCGRRRTYGGPDAFTLFLYVANCKDCLREHERERKDQR